MLANKNRTILSLTVVLLTSARGYAGGLVPAEGNFLTSWGSTGLVFISDGTSNAIGFTDATRLNFCVDNVGIQGTPISNPIRDGSSNTLLFGESSGIALNVGFIARRQPITQIADGTSNTIQLGEAPVDSFCLGNVTPIGTTIGDGTSNTIVFGGDSRFDICADNVRIGHIVDGTSNTISFGEVVPRTCLSDVGVTEAPADAVPEPGTFALFGLAFSSFVLRRRRRRRQH